MSDFYEKSVDVVSASVEASRLVRQVAEPRQIGDSVKAAQRRVLHRVNHWCKRNTLPSWSAHRVKSFWYRDKRAKPRADELTALRALTLKKRDDKAAADELAELRSRVSRLETLLAVSDPEALGADGVVVRQNLRNGMRTAGAEN